MLLFLVRNRSTSVQAGAAATIAAEKTPPIAGRGAGPKQTIRSQLIKSLINSEEKYVENLDTIVDIIQPVSEREVSFMIL